jgi:hypothetical protein
MQTVYEISWMNITVALWPGLFFAVVSTVLWISGWRQEQGFRRVRFFICWMICVVIGTCWVVVVVRIGCRNKTALRTGQCRVAEGMVSVLHRETKANHVESIQIGTEVFSFCDSEDINDHLRYHWIIKNGGPLTNGAYARLHVWNENILKVEIKR